MKYLLDTCVITELIKPKPDNNVVHWVKSQVENQLYISVLTLGEISKGIEKVRDELRRKKLLLWVENDLRERFQRRILPVNEQVAMIWGQIQGMAEKQGRRMPAIDSLIAATGLAFNMVVVTRNISDMQTSGAVLLDPWNLRNL